MEHERIKEIRNLLGITQEDMAIILGVTKVTVGRYENGQVKPVGDAEKKLLQLDNALKVPDQKKIIFDMLHSSNGKTAGAAAIAAAVSLGAAVLPLSLIGASGVGIISALSSPAAILLYNTIKKIVGDEK